MKILNLYAGIGGNRKLWGGGDSDNMEITAVEYNEEIAGIYKEYFPEDKVIVGDAHQYLLDHYKEFDFIWGSPPCPSHSRIRMMASKKGDYKAIFPDMTLWQEIIFLNGFCRKDQYFCIENVKPYYEPLVKETIELDRHLFWTNFNVNKYEFGKDERKHNHVKPSDQLYGYDLTKYNIEHDKIKILRNMVNPDLGLYILEQALGIIRKKDTTQTELFN